ncbi:unnamed protein product [Spirodela intermedia]|uniref:Uncharacterized protein n=2 Tax=Spirodela intermedia TaxID=51605 RepID=A0A7I8IGB3_SPIIN|nr:unnamed protein product [Spirodela intermedia]CAA6656113.1 unnamed protein product [Spirodela intermedia]CAA7391563.1 unnamed protein product [Spirodela intermedia]
MSFPGSPLEILKSYGIRTISSTLRRLVSCNSSISSSKMRIGKRLGMMILLISW